MKVGVTAGILVPATISKRLLMSILKENSIKYENDRRIQKPHTERG